jgi:hypothetical protein
MTELFLPIYGTFAASRAMHELGRIVFDGHRAARGGIADADGARNSLML